MRALLFCFSTLAPGKKEKKPGDAFSQSHTHKVHKMYALGLLFSTERTGCSVVGTETESHRLRSACNAGGTTRLWSFVYAARWRAMSWVVREECEILLVFRQFGIGEGSSIRIKVCFNYLFSV